MFTLATLAVAAHLNVIPMCDWTDRGLDKFMGDVPSAVDNYVDIPPDIRAALKAKMQDPRGYEDIAHLTVDGHQSDRWVYSPPTMMHFGDGRKICATLDISKWAKNDTGERGLVYCVGGYCVTVFTICRNVSRTSVIGPRPGRESPPLPPEEPTASIPPVPVSVPPEIGIPPIETYTFPEELPLGSFSRQSQPVPVPGTQDEPPPRLSANQPFYELWARPLFWSTGLVPTPARFFTFVPPGADAPPTVSVGLPPVPGVVPPAYVPPAQNVPLPPTVTPDPKSPDYKLPDGDLPINTAPIPEPATVVMWLIGILGLYMFTRRRNTRE